jgi:hypothetical protein
VAKSNRGRGGRSRKRRPATVTTAAGAPAPAGRATGAGRAGAGRPRAARQAPETPPAGVRARRAPGAGSAERERPRAPWHPLPLSEILIAVGIAAMAISLSRGSPAVAPLLAGVGALLLGTLEVTLREHLSGFRSHALILALIPTILFHSLAIVVLVAVTRVTRAINIALLVPDAVIATALFKLLRARFLDVRRERMFSGGR